MCLPADENGVAQVVPVQLQEIDALSSVRIYISKDLRQPDARALGLKVTHLLLRILQMVWFDLKIRICARQSQVGVRCSSA